MALHSLAQLRLREPLEVVDKLESHDLSRIPIEMPGYIEFMSELIRLSKQRLEITEVYSKAIIGTILSGIERGQRNPTLRNIRRIAEALGVRVREFVRI